MSYLLFFSKSVIDASNVKAKVLDLTSMSIDGEFLYSFGIHCFRTKIESFLTRETLIGLRSHFVSEKIDILQISHLIPKNSNSIAVFDMDSTVIKEEVIDELARLHGVYEEVSRVTKEAMEGGLSFDEALRKRVANLKGLSSQGFETVANQLNLNEGMLDLFAHLPSYGCKIAILSGGFTPILDLFTKKYPVDFYRANFLKSEDGIFTGEISGEIVNREKKEFYLNRLLEQFSIERKNSIAVGDGANDSLMLNASGVGIGFHAKSGLKSEISNWVDFVGMQAVLFLFE
ncbi:MAG: phosphoserine phosphatase SerB [Leptospira sp.]|nr:phosphoserine phosphatase SerB [Leptospira sp.]